MLRLLFALSACLLLLAPTDAQALPPRGRGPGARPPRHAPPPAQRPACGPRGCMTDLVGDLESAVETDSGGTAATPTNAAALSDFPNDDSYANVQAMLQFAAEHYGIPLDLVYATAWTESKWQQWEADGSAVQGGDDYGLMQVNKPTWSGTYDWIKVTGDVRENIRAGAEILEWSYDYAKSKGYTGDDLARAAYAVYNGGPDAVSRPWDSSSAWHQNDVNFWNAYHGRGWESSS